MNVTTFGAGEAIDWRKKTPCAVVAQWGIHGLDNRSLVYRSVWQPTVVSRSKVG